MTRHPQLTSARRRVGDFLPLGVTAETRGSEAEVFSSDCLRLCVPVLEEALDLMYLSHQV